MLQACQINLAGSRQGPVVGFWEHGNEPFKFPNHLNNNQFTKDEPVPRTFFSLSWRDSP